MTGIIIPVTPFTATHYSLSTKVAQYKSYASTTSINTALLAYETKIDEILAWERRSETERDTRFVELGRYLCEVRAGQYWRLEKLKSLMSFWRGGSRNP